MGLMIPLKMLELYKKLVNITQISEQQLVESSFSINYAVNSTKYCIENVVNQGTLQPLIRAKVITKGMAGKIAGSGLKLCHLNLAFRRGGKEGLSSVFCQKVNGKVRVTNSKRILLQLEYYFRSESN